MVKKSPKPADPLDPIQGYAGLRSATASNRRYLDIEPNISVKDSYNRDDYYGFRPSEGIGGSDKSVMRKCGKAYENVGLIKQVIDLMGDFASQGVRISHTNKSIERFYKRWWEKVQGHERCERFLNILYRLGNVVIYKANGKITKKEQKQMSKAAEKRVIPFRYDFLNPLCVELDGDHSDIFVGDKKYVLKLNEKTREALKKKGQIKKNGQDLPLDPDRLSIYHYKKDDWCIWANPMIHAILDDITMMEKMKLADMSALDGAISNIRLWTLGSMEHKIPPTRAAIDRLRDILATNVGGGTMDLVWGDELKFQESNSQIYHFLGSEKYGPVLNSIYGGLGVPQTLTGSTSGGGFTNNFLSLKTLIEKLEYGRGLLIDFWKKEFQLVAEAMGFDSPAELRFDHMVLSDEAAEKNLWIQLSDRHLISAETVREKFGESHVIEESRIVTEEKLREKRKMPPKADPFHNGNLESDYAKIALQNQTMKISDVTDYPYSVPPKPPGSGLSPSKKTKSPNGRPRHKSDTTKRKQRIAKPKSKASFASTLLWATDAQKQIASILTPVMLSQYGRKNMRELTTTEGDELELIKFVALCGMEPFSEVDEKSVAVSMSRKIQVDTTSFYRDFLEKNNREPNLDELRQLRTLAYVCQDF